MSISINKEPYPVCWYCVLWCSVGILIDLERFGFVWGRLVMLCVFSLSCLVPWMLVLCLVLFYWQLPESDYRNWTGLSLPSPNYALDSDSSPESQSSVSCISTDQQTSSTVVSSPNWTLKAQSPTDWLILLYLSSTHITLKRVLSLVPFTTMSYVFGKEIYVWDRNI